MVVPHLPHRSDVEDSHWVGRNKEKKQGGGGEERRLVATESEKLRHPKPYKWATIGLQVEGWVNVYRSPFHGV